jgi:type I restriction enzyme S subunit
MKEGWEIKKLGDCFKLKSGDMLSTKEMKTGDIPVYGGNGISGYHDKFNLDSENVIIGRVGALCGNVRLINSKIWLTDNAFFISDYKYQFNKSFLTYLLNYKDLRNYARQAAQPVISNSSLDRVELNFPKSVPEQQRIVSILDEAFAAIDRAKAHAEKNLKNAKELFESYLQGVFEKGDWEKKKLQDVAKVFGRGKSKHRPRNWEGLYGGNYPFIQTGEVRNANKYITTYTQTYNEIGLAQSKLWKKGTICITIAANIAETAILDFDACIPDSIIGFEVDDRKADLNFAYYLLQHFKTELQKLGKGSAQDNINLGTFENQFFPFPEINVQQTIVRQLDALRAETQKLEAVYRKKLDDLEELKKSILQKAFAGELKTEKEIVV